MAHPSVPPVTLVTAQPVLALDLDDARGGDETPQRQCGRCRGTFEGDPTLDTQGRQEWWLCPPCDAVLMAGRNRSRKSNVIPIRPAQAPVEASTTPHPAAPDTP